MDRVGCPAVRTAIARGNRSIVPAPSPGSVRALPPLMYPPIRPQRFIVQREERWTHPTDAGQQGSAAPRCRKRNQPASWVFSLSTDDDCLSSLQPPGSERAQSLPRTPLLTPHRRSAERSTAGAPGVHKAPLSFPTSLLPTPPRVWPVALSPGAAHPRPGAERPTGTVPPLSSSRAAPGVQRRAPLSPRAFARNDPGALSGPPDHAHSPAIDGMNCISLSIARGRREEGVSCRVTAHRREQLHAVDRRRVARRDGVDLGSSVVSARIPLPGGGSRDRAGSIMGRRASDTLSGWRHDRLPSLSLRLQTVGRKECRVVLFRPQASKEDGLCRQPSRVSRARWPTLTQSSRIGGTPSKPLSRAGRRGRKECRVVLSAHQRCMQGGAADPV